MIQVRLSQTDIIRLAAPAILCKGLVVACRDGAVASPKDEPCVEGTVLFTFAHPSNTSGSGITEHRTAKGEMLGIVDNSCDFGFHCIVPECPFPIDRADATHVARLQVEVMVKAPADAETRASAGNEGNQDFGKGRQLFKDDVKQFRITDTDVEGGYVYWSSGLQERADKAMTPPPARACTSRTCTRSRTASAALRAAPPPAATPPHSCARIGGADGRCGWAVRVGSSP